jgi:hypothetical protein
MALPGTTSPSDRFPKDGAETKLKCSPGGKCESDEMLAISQTASKVGPASTSRVYTRDYSKGRKDPDQTDLVTAALGNPFRL